MKIVLASTSEFRRELAEKQLNMPVEKAASGFDEKLLISTIKPKTPEEHVQLISKGKLKATKEARKQNYINNKEDEIILCYDTVVFSQGQILEKPKDKEDLISKVQLWGHENIITSIYTGISIGKLSTDDEDYHKVKKADFLFLRNFSEEEYNAYLNDEIVKSIAGAFMIEKLLPTNLAKIIEGTTDIIFPIEETKSAIKKIMEKK